MFTEDIQQLRRTFSDVQALPPLPHSTIRLIQAIDRGDASALDLERIIVSDPGLMAGVIRSASSAAFGASDARPTTVKAAILRLGQNAVRALCISLAIQAMVDGKSPTGNFDAKRFAHHAIFVGFLSRYLFSHRMHREPFRSRWSAEEVFAAGILHDLPLAILSRVSSRVYDLLYLRAERRQCGLDEALESPEDMSELGGLAADAWGLPEVFGFSMRHFRRPEGKPEEEVALSAIHLANVYAERAGHSIEPWTRTPEPSALAVELVGLDEDALESVLEAATRHTVAYLGGSVRSAA